MFKKQFGVWIDFKEATIVELKGNKAIVTRIPSGIEDFHLVGGSRSKVPWGPMEKSSESKLAERRKHQSQLYYQRIATILQKADQLFIFGPAEAKFGLRSYLKTQKPFNSIIKGILTADSMSLNQKIAQTKSFFKSHS